MDLIYSIVGFVLAISILVFIHELGHFLIARLFKVRVLKFSIGFGPGYSLGCDKFGTEYLISAIPLGGYIQLLDTSEPDCLKNAITTEYQHQAINTKSAWIRMAILFAGPIFNLIFALFVYTLVFIIGISNNLPIVGTVRSGSIADLAGINSGMQITKIANKQVSDWGEVVSNILKELSNNSTKISIETRDFKRLEVKLHSLQLDYDSKQISKGDLLKNFGLEPLVFMDPKIWQIVAKYPAAKAGLKSGDIIISLDDLIIQEPKQVFDYIYDKAGKLLNVKVLRGKKHLFFKVEPILKNSIDPKDGAVIGIKYRDLPYPQEFTMNQKYKVIEALHKAWSKTYDNVLLSSYFLISIFKGKLSFSNAAGPLAIGYYAGQSIKSGVEYFLNFLAMISINLGVLNLLPIPWLDGGSIVHCIYELIMRKPANPKLIYWGRNISLIFLLGLAIVVFINDLIRL